MILLGLGAHTQQRRRLSRLTAILTLACALLALSASNALASHNQLEMFQDDVALQADPAGTLSRLHDLGVQYIRMSITWQRVVPASNSTHRPHGFNAADPAAYPARNWSVYDTIITLAKQQGIGVYLDIVGGAPRWAEGGHPAKGSHGQWSPSASEYGKFVRAVGTRYSGSYTPGGASSSLPRVSTWSVWNEPDYGPSLAPQGVYPNHITVENSPHLYRNLVDAAWTALHRTGHGGDTFAFGELAPRGVATWGVFSGMKPLIFLRAMYCVDGHYRRLRGTAAALRGCPTTAAGSRRFRSQHPALFHASAFSDHMYMRWYPPNRELHNDPNFASLGDFGQLARALDRLQRVYGSPRRLPVYNTEFGYITSPPKHTNKYPWVSQQTAADYINWAEYISWRNPRILSYEQFLLRDPLPPHFPGDPGGFASGLLNYDGTTKPSYAAFRMPIFMPKSSARRGRSLEVWGCVRPAHNANAQTGLPQVAQIEFAPNGSSSFMPVSSIPITDPGGYFDTRVVFPSGGNVIISWTYPSGQQVTSRHVHITIH